MLIYIMWQLLDMNENKRKEKGGDEEVKKEERQRQMTRMLVNSGLVIDKQ